MIFVERGISLEKQYFYKKKFVFISGCLIGALIFICIYGIKVLDFTYDGWLMTGGDLSQHYMGWRIFRKSGWNFPIGLMDGATYPFKVSTIYMDTIPIFAITFKIISPILPETFQYFGLWGIMSFMLQGGIAALIIEKVSKNVSLCILSSLFFIVQPIVISRMFAHTALAGQWIILLAIYMYIELDEQYSIKNKMLIWALLSWLSTMIHMYFVPMIMILNFCFWIKEYLKNRKLIFSISSIFISIITILITLFILGAFYGSVSIGSDGLGFYSANINALFNPIGFSYFLKDLPLATSGQYEGLAYLGFGVLTLLIIVIFLELDEIESYNFKEFKSYPLSHTNKFTLLIATIMLIVLALSPKIGLNSKILLDVKYPKIVEKLLSVFRSSGRFMWPVCYLIIIYTIKELSIRSKRVQLSIIIIICSILQIGDLSNILIQKKEEFNVNVKYESRLQAEGWGELVQKGYKHIVFMSEINDISPDNKLIYDFSKYATENNLTLNDGYLARKDNDGIEKIRKEYWNKLKEDFIDENVIYVFKDINLEEISFMSGIPDNISINYYNMDGVIIGIKGKLESEKEYKPQFIEKGVTILPIDNKYISNGYDTNDGRVLNASGISFGPYINLSRGIYKIEISGENLEKTDYDICFNQGQDKLNLQEEFRDNNKIIFHFELETNIQKFECRIFNRSDEDIEIKKITILNIE